MGLWLGLLVLGVVLLILARFAFPSPPVDRILYAVGVICLVLALVFFVFWIVNRGAAEVDTYDAMRTVLLA